MRQVAPPRPATLVLGFHGFNVVGAILAGTRHHRDIKEAFDWESTPEGHMFWSRVRRSETLSSHARYKLECAYKAAEPRLLAPNYM